MTPDPDAGELRREAWLEVLFEYAPDAFYIVDLKGVFLDGNRAAEQLVGYRRDELIGKTFLELNLLSKRDLAAGAKALVKNMAGRPTGPDEFTLHRKDGSTVSVEIRTYPVTVGGRRVVLGIARDLIDRKNRDERIRWLTRATEQSPAAIVLTDVDGNIEYVNRTFTEITGYTAEEALSQNPRLLKSGKNPPEVYQELWRTITAGNVWRGELLNQRKDGTLYWDRSSISPVRDDDGNITHFVAVKEDISELKGATNELRQANERLRALFDSSPIAIYSIDLEGNVESWNPAAERLFGWSAEEVLGHRIPYVPEDRAQEFADSVQRVRREGMITGAEVKRLRKDGTLVDLNLSVARLDDAGGAAVGMLAIAQDVTAVKTLEHQFRQAQKMEAVGRLAGGVAHDFNNILTAISGFTELAASTLDEQHPARADVEQIRLSAQRAAALTRQLLAFSRQQVLAPRNLDLGHLVEGLREMLGRLLGEDIRLTTHVAADLGTVRADPGQIEQVIMNLAINARDAMPDGGELRLELDNADLDEPYARTHIPAQPGPYVRLAVSDTGVGMDEATQGNIFEPFFTTKEAGRGTGLGLSTVYGIVKQSDGFIWVYSTPGQGTSFKIYLPRVSAPADVATVAKQPAEAARGHETVLLAEDDVAVRRVTARALEHAGYRVLQAGSGEEALELADRHGEPIHVLITDVVMPGMRGDVLAKRMHAAHPDMRVLFTSGYTGEYARGRGVIPSGAVFVQKPFTIEEITHGVRRALDNPTAA